MKFFRSLQAKYMLLILIALSLIFLIQIGFVIIGTLWVDRTQKEEPQSEEKIETRWHEEAGNLKKISHVEIARYFAKWKQQYPSASMFWIDGNGRLAEQIDVKEKLPSEWTSTDTAKFIKDRYGQDPFTVIAFVGQDHQNGFVVLEMPRDFFAPPLQIINEEYGMVLLMVILMIIALFITISFLFFRGIRKRLLQLQEAMEIRDVDSLPIRIDVKKKDEVGQLEQTFNQMVDELRKSKQREQAEEQLRREFIANLSHDLRTPLTKINAQTYSLKKLQLPAEAAQGILRIETSIRDIDRLIENLMSYTLLMASKYHYHPQTIDVVRFVRESFATWYSVFEKEGFEIVVDLQPFKENFWEIDPVWFGRILDNLLQNVLRHAKSGLYIEMKTVSTEQYDAFVIKDRGKGMKQVSHEKGVGIGLSIVDMMVKGMKLDWDIDSSENGTTIQIKRYKLNVFGRK